jgi:hypothetical protein
MNSTQKPYDWLLKLLRVSTEEEAREKFASLSRYYGFTSLANENPSQVASAKFKALVDAYQARCGVSYDTAWRAVKSTSEGKALWAQMEAKTR